MSVVLTWGRARKARKGVWGNLGKPGANGEGCPWFPPPAARRHPEGGAQVRCVSWLSVCGQCALTVRESNVVEFCLLPACVSERVLRSSEVPGGFERPTWTHLLGSRSVWSISTGTNAPETCLGLDEDALHNHE